MLVLVAHFIAPTHKNAASVALGVVSILFVLPALFAGMVGATIDDGGCLDAQNGYVRFEPRLAPLISAGLRQMCRAKSPMRHSPKRNIRA